jgi:hypothetical protein
VGEPAFGEPVPLGVDEGEELAHQLAVAAWWRYRERDIR